MDDNRSNSGKPSSSADGNPEPSPTADVDREGVEARRAASNGREAALPLTAYDEGMVQRTNARRDKRRRGHESAGVTKGEVVSSILTGSTIFPLRGQTQQRS